MERGSKSESSTAQIGAAFFSCPPIKIVPYPQLITLQVKVLGFPGFLPGIYSRKKRPTIKICLSGHHPLGDSYLR
jgi:hypothetical protein